MTECKTAPGVSAEETLAYIEARYLSLEALAERSGVSPARIEELIAAECAPPHSYAIAGEMTVESAFGAYRLPMTSRRFYAPALVDWIRRADPLAREIGLEAAARAMREAFLGPIGEALPSRWANGPEEAWALLRDGSWSLCLDDITPEAVIAKESARSTLADAQAGAGDRAAAIAAYDSVATPFAPHERPESSRVREVDPHRAR